MRPFQTWTPPTTDEVSSAKAQSEVERPDIAALVRQLEGEMHAPMNCTLLDEAADALTALQADMERLTQEKYEAAKRWEAESEDIQSERDALQLACYKAEADVEKLTEERDKAREWSRLRAEDIMTLGKALGEAETNIARLTHENSELRTQDDPRYTYAFKGRAEAAERRVEELRKALKPFAELAKNYETGDDGEQVVPLVEVGSFRRARTAYKGREEPLALDETPPIRETGSGPVYKGEGNG